MPDYKHMRKQQVVDAARQAKQEQRRREKEERRRLAGEGARERVRRERRERREKDRDQRRPRPVKARPVRRGDQPERRWTRRQVLAGAGLAVLAVAIVVTLLLAGKLPT